jgi:hypothetical protein
MIPYNGNTIYRVSNGEPVRVEKTRKRTGYHEGLTRVYLSDGHNFDCNSQGDWLTEHYTPENTPALTRLWAKELLAKAKREEEWQRQLDEERANRAANADLYNAPPVWESVQVLDDGRPDVVELRAVTTAYTPNYRDGTPQQVTRTYAVTVVKRGADTIAPDGSYQYTNTFGVNWGTIGNTDTETARRYAAMILQACDIADAKKAAILTTTEEPANA